MNFPLWLNVQVKLIDIALGRIANCLACPIHLALERMGYRHFTVNDQVIEFANGVKYQTSKAARDFIWSFDTGRHVYAGSFTFRRTSLPETVLSSATGGMGVDRG